MSSARHVAVKQLPQKLSVKHGRIFFREVESCLTADRPRVVLDGSKLEQLDSAGVRLLLRCLEEAMKRNGDVKLAAIPPAAAASLELARVDHLFESFDNTVDAVNSFSQFQAKPFPQTLRHEYSSLSSRAQRNRFQDHPSVSLGSRRDPGVTMRSWGRWLRRHITGCLVLLFIAPLAAAVPSPPQEASPRQQAESVSSRQTHTTAKTPDGTIPEQAEPSQPEALPNSPGAVNSQEQSSSVQQPSPEPQNGTQEPLGTAAATFVKTTGVAASRPAGAAIAPAKQRRARSILIKVGVIAGAGIAVGTVFALSTASPGHPH